MLRYESLSAYVAIVFSASTFSGLVIANARTIFLFIQATGEDYSVEPTETRRPFRALLDVGLVMTTTGNRVFGALKVSFLLSTDIWMNEVFRLRLNWVEFTFSYLGCFGWWT